MGGTSAIERNSYHSGWDVKCPPISGISIGGASGAAAPGAKRRQGPMKEEK